MNAKSALNSTHHHSDAFNFPNQLRDADQMVPDTNSDIIQKINAILDNKLDLGDFLAPGHPATTMTSNGAISRGQSASPPHPAAGVRAPIRDLNNNALSSPSSDSVYFDFETPPSEGDGSRSPFSNASRSSFSNGSPTSPFCTGPSVPSANALSDMLGLASPKSASSSVKTYKYGEFKFPDVSSPLNKILSRSRRNGSEFDPPPPYSPSNVLSPRARQLQRTASDSYATLEDYRRSAGSPTLDEAILMGAADKWGGVGRRSPGSDGSSYGTSYCSNSTLGGGDGGSPVGARIRGSVSRDQDSGISDLFRGLNLSDSQAGSYGSSSGAGNNSLLDSPSPFYTSSRSTSSPPLASISEMDPAVAQAVKNIQNLQALCNSGPPLNDLNSNETNVSSSLERAARIHRNGTAIYDASCTWHGELPQRKDNNIQLSCKVFLGGVPWDITETTLYATFKPFGPIKIEWPGKDNSSVPRGYLYIIFENEKQVRDLLTACTHDYGNGGSWYYKVSSRRMRNKEVQVIPWVIGDSNYIRCPSQGLDPKKTVFVGALHGMLNAEGLCKIFNDLFKGVVYAGIDTDKYKYPQGSGRVTFNNHQSYMKAVSAAFIDIKATKFSKKVQVDPYLEDELCSSCGLRQGPYFCREQVCFKYFCRFCWEVNHGIEYSHHNPLMRNSKPNNGSRTVTVNLPFTD